MSESTWDSSLLVACDYPSHITLLKRLQIFDEIVFLFIREPEVKAVVIAADDVGERLEASVVIKAAFILRKHKKTALAHKYARQVHRLIRMSGGAIGFEAVDLHLIGRMLIPTRFRPQWFTMTAIAVGLAAEKFVSTSGGRRIEIDAGAVAPQAAPVDRSAVQPTCR